MITYPQYYGLDGSPGAAGPGSYSPAAPGGPAWQFEVDNLTGTPPATGPGTGFTYGGASADGAAVTLLTALANEVQYVVLAINGADTNAEDNSALGYLLVDTTGQVANWAAGTVAVKIADLVCGANALQNTNIGPSHWYHFPLKIPAGASVGWRARKAGATASTNGKIAIWCYGKPKNPTAWWCGDTVEALGTTAASSKGTSHTPGNTGAFSAFAAVGTSTRRYGAIQFGTNGSDGTMLAVGYYWQLGLAGAQLAGTPTIFRAGSTAETGVQVSPGPIFVDIPAASAIQVRGTCSGVAEAWDVAAYGVYKASP